jgi:ABC-2 type transport system ATP-binding protein
MDDLIELSHLTRYYGQHAAVNDLSLTIARGEIFGLLGPNGAGKSTTMKMLATLLLPTAGTARIAGHDLVTAANEVRRHIGYVPESGDLYETLTGREFLDLVRDLHRLPAAEAAMRRAALLRLLDLDDFIDNPVGEYSKGMRQKLLLTAALQHDPPVLLLDEPLDGLDVASQEVFKRLLRERADTGGAVVYSSHILEVVERLCTRVAILVAGRMATLGRPRDLVEQAGAESLSQLFLRLTRAAGGKAGPQGEAQAAASTAPPLP